ncbi:MAG: hypothetical protein F4142_06745 [Nitrospira sp. SB0675_bin_23]|nr:hypothetical protein [Nitrospira sp. SB0675_bin_23]
MAAVRGPRLLEAMPQVVLAAMSPGAASLPKASQAARAAPAARTPVRFPVIARSDGNEPGAPTPAGVTGDRKTNGSVPR